MKVVPAAAPPVAANVTEFVTEPAVVADIADVADVANVAVAALPVQEPELPVVFWLSVGNVQFVSVPEEGVPSAPPGAT